MKFKEFKMNEHLMEALSYMGFDEATPIQEQAIPVIMDGKDLIASAQTGTGKTAAFCCLFYISLRTSMIN